MNSEKIVSLWNSKIKIGDEVAVFKDFSDYAIITETTSEAWVMCGGEPSVMIKGISGAYALTHVRPTKYVND